MTCEHDDCNDSRAMEFDAREDAAPVTDFVGGLMSQEISLSQKVADTSNFFTEDHYSTMHAAVKEISCLLQYASPSKANQIVGNVLDQVTDLKKHLIEKNYCS